MGGPGSGRHAEPAPPVQFGSSYPMMASAIGATPSGPITQTNLTGLEAYNGNARFNVIRAKQLILTQQPGDSINPVISLPFAAVSSDWYLNPDGGVHYNTDFNYDQDIYFATPFGLKFSLASTMEPRLEVYVANSGSRFIGSSVGGVSNHLIGSSYGDQVLNIDLPNNQTILAGAPVVISDITTAGFVKSDSSGLLSGGNKESFTLQGSAQTPIIPGASTTYYFGTPLAGLRMATGADLYRIYIPVACTLIAVYVNFTNTSTASTTETGTVSFRLNNTTDVTVTSAFTCPNVSNNFSATGLSTACAAGDYFEIKVVTPAWVTAPGTMYGSVTAYFEKT